MSAVRGDVLSRGAASARAFPSRALLALTALAIVIVIAGCSGEDRPANVEVIGGGFVSVSGADDSAGGVPTGIRYVGTTNQDVALGAALDLRDLRSVINVAIDGRAVDWTRATQLYEAGRNQRRADGSVRSLASLADADVGAQFPGGAPVYGRDAFVDGLVRDGLTGTGLAEGRGDNARRALVERGVQMLLYGRVLHALGEAERLLTSDAGGATAALDEAWAYLAGPADAESARLTSLLGVAINVENAASQPGRLTRPLEAAFITARAAAEKRDGATFDVYAREARGELATIFYTGTLASLDRAQATEREDTRDALLADALGSFQAIRGSVAAVSPTGAATIEGVLERSPAQPVSAAEVATVHQALNQPGVVDALGIPSGFRNAAGTRP
jgi:hypothetical protein